VLLKHALELDITTALVLGPFHVVFPLVWFLKQITLHFFFYSVLILK